jgi:outer membrane protein OmpA-like peptidoglycan-associated protein
MNNSFFKLASIISFSLVIFSGCDSIGTSNTTNALIGGDTESTLIGVAIDIAAGALIGYSLDKQVENIAKSLGTGVNNDSLESHISYKVAKVGNILKQYPKTTVEVAGYTNDRGGYNYNYNLSTSRAKSVSNKLYATGIDNPSYTTSCCSYKKALMPNDSPSNMALNRRVEIYLYPNNEARTNPCL